MIVFLKRIIALSLTVPALLATLSGLAAEDDWLDQVARFLGISKTPSQLKASGDSLKGGDIFIAAIGGPPNRLTTGGDYRSPIFLLGGEGLLALKGDAVVQLPLSGETGQKLQSAPHALKLLGVDASDADRVLMLLETPDDSSDLGMFSLKSGQVTPLPHDHDSKTHRRMMSHLRGDDREYEGITVYVKTESKARLGGQVEWTDVYLRRGNEAPINVSRCDGVNCGQPALSPDGLRVVFIRAIAAR